MDTAVDPGVIIITAIFSAVVGVLLYARRSRERKIADRAHAALERGWTADENVKETLDGSGVLFRFRGRTPKGLPWILEAERHVEGPKESRNVWGFTAWRIGDPGRGDPAMLVLSREVYEALRGAQGGIGGAVAFGLFELVLGRVGRHDSPFAVMLARRQAALQTAKLQEQFVALVADQVDATRLLTLEAERALHRLLTVSDSSANGGVALLAYLAAGAMRLVIPAITDVETLPILEALVHLGAVLAETAEIQAEQ